MSKDNIKVDLSNKTAHNLSLTNNDEIENKIIKYSKENKLNTGQELEIFNKDLAEISNKFRDIQETDNKSTFSAINLGDRLNNNSKLIKKENLEKLNKTTNNYNIETSNNSFNIGHKSNNNSKLAIIHVPSFKSNNSNNNEENNDFFQKKKVSLQMEGLYNQHRYTANSLKAQYNRMYTEEIIVNYNNSLISSQSNINSHRNNINLLEKPKSFNLSSSNNYLINKNNLLPIKKKKQNCTSANNKTKKLLIYKKPKIGCRSLTPKTRAFFSVDNNRSKQLINKNLNLNQNDNKNDNDADFDGDTIVNINQPNNICYINNINNKFKKSFKNNETNLCNNSNQSNMSSINKVYEFIKKPSFINKTEISLNSHEKIKGNYFGNKCIYFNKQETFNLNRVNSPKKLKLKKILNIINNNLEKQNKNIIKENILVCKYKKIFDSLDSDRDGFITSEYINLNYLSETLLKELNTLLKSTLKDNAKIGFKDFYIMVDQCLPLKKLIDNEIMESK